MINFASNLNKMINAGLGGPLDPPRTEVAVGHRVIYTEVSGAVASFETNVIAPVKNLRVTMEPVQAGSGDPSPENIRPITGRDSVTVTRTGKNLIPDHVEIVGKYSPTGGVISNSSYSTLYFPVPKGILSWHTNAKRFGAYSCLIDEPPSPGVVTYKNVTITNRNNYNFDNTDGHKYMAFFLTIAVTDANQRIRDFEAYVNYAENLGYSDPSDSQSVTVQLGQTVYGGTVDVTGGSAESEWSLVDLGTLNWTYYSTKLVFYASSPIPRKKYGFTNIICTAYKSRTALTGNNWNLQDKEIGGGNNSYYIYIKDLSYTDAETFKASLRGVMACYEMDMPTEITTIPAQLSTLAGENNVWSDAGDISLEYPYYEETEGY